MKKPVVVPAFLNHFCDEHIMDLSYRMFMVASKDADKKLTGKFPIRFFRLPMLRKL